MGEAPKHIRRVYLSSFLQGLGVTWPILSGLLLLKCSLGIVVALFEGWSIWQGLYFAFVTGLTIGYGDLVPRQVVTQALAIALGFCGILLTGLVAALAVRALQATAMAPQNADRPIGTKPSRREHDQEPRRPTNSRIV